MRWLDGIVDSMDMRERVKYRVAWRAAVHVGVTESDTGEEKPWQKELDRYESSGFEI